MRLNLGANDRRVEGFISVDIAPPADQIVDLEGPWPWDDSSIEEALAFDVAEHIGDCNHSSAACKSCLNSYWDANSMRIAMGIRHPLGRVHFMNELHRVLQPGGRATIEVPNAAKGVGFICDPTHKTPWCLSTFKYFEAGTFAHGRLSKSYGITASFRVVKLEEIECSGEDPRERVWKIKATLEAVK
jgi:hypothetical protein